MTQEIGSLEGLVRPLLRDADCSSNTIAAILMLAKAYDEHRRSCPHIEPPAARPYIPTMLERLGRAQ